MQETNGLREQKILLFAPSEPTLAQAIGDAGFDCEVCADAGELCRKLETGAAAVLCDEALQADERQPVERALRRQPSWSDIPVLLLAAPGHAPFSPPWEVERLGNATVLDRPLSPRTLLSSLHSAVRARRRQYEFRDHLVALGTIQGSLQAKEVDLRRHLAEFEALLEVLPVGIFIARDPECRVITTNPAGARVLGISSRMNVSSTGDEAEWLPYRIFMGGAEVPPDELPVQLAARTGKSIEGLELEVVRGDGSRADLYAYASPLYDDSGRVRGALGVFVDITERKGAEQALRQSEERFQAFMTHTPALAFMKDDQGRYLYANSAVEEAFQWNASSWRGRRDADLWPSEVAARLEQNDLKVLASGVPQQFHETFPTAAGERRFLTYKFLFQGPGGCTYLGANALDITDRERAAEALRESEERYRGIFNQAAIGIGRSTLDRVLIDINPGFCHILGYEAEELLSAEALDLGHPDDVIITEEAVDELLSGRHDTISLEKRYRHKQGHYVWVQATASLTRRADGTPEHIIAVFQDITERKHAEEALKEANRRKDEFLAILAHELRNPLAPIRNALQILSRRGEEPGIRGRFTEMMDRQLSQLVRLVDDLLEVSRITSGKIELRKELVDLRQVIAGAVETSRPLIEAAGHTLGIHLAPEPLVLLADPVRMAQMLANLLNNSAKYTERGGHIVLSAWREDGDVVVSVRDTGAGIAPDLLPRVFEMFAQAHHEPGRPQGGLGIGLSLVKNLVQLHGGSIEARSEGPGCGSEFVLRLPSHSASQKQHDRRKPSEQSGTASEKPLRILVADDNVDSADSIAALLQMLGHDVSLAYSGRAAVEAACSHHPEVMLLDIGLPEMDGYEVARRLRQHPEFQEILLIAMTGYGQMEDRRLSHEAGFDEHLVKPVDFSVLQSLLSQRPPWHSSARH